MNRNPKCCSSTPADKKHIHPDDSLPYSEIKSTGRKRPKKVRTRRFKRIKDRNRNESSTESDSEWETETEELEAKVIYKDLSMEEVQEEYCSDVQVKLNEKFPVTDEWQAPECVRDDQTALEVNLNTSFPGPAALYTSICYDGYESEAQIFIEAESPRVNVPRISGNDENSKSILNESTLHDFENCSVSKRRKGAPLNLRTYGTTTKNPIQQRIASKRAISENVRSQGDGYKSRIQKNSDIPGSNDNMSSYRFYPQWAATSEKLWESFMKECPSQNTSRSNMKESFSKENLVSVDTSSDELEETLILENCTEEKTIDASHNKSDVKNVRTTQGYSKGEGKTSYSRNVSSKVSEEHMLHTIKSIKRLSSNNVYDKSTRWNGSEILILDSEDDEIEGRKLPAPSASSRSIANKNSESLKVEKQSRNRTKEPCYLSVTVVQDQIEQYDFIKRFSDNESEHEAQQNRKYKRIKNTNHTSSLENAGNKIKKKTRKTIERVSKETFSPFSNKIKNSTAGGKGRKESKPKQRTTDASKFIVGVDWSSEWTDVNESRDPEIISMNEAKKCPQSCDSSKPDNVDTYNSLSQMEVDSSDNDVVCLNSNNITIRKYKHLRNNKENRLEPMKEESMLSGVENDVGGENLFDEKYNMTPKHNIEALKCRTQNEIQNIVSQKSNTRELCSGMENNCSGTVLNNIPEYEKNKNMLPRTPKKYDTRKDSVLPKANRYPSNVMQENQKVKLGAISKPKPMPRVTSNKKVNINYKIVKKNP